MPDRVSDFPHQVLTQQSDFQSARKHWKVLKGRLAKEGGELVTNCDQLKMTASDGKPRPALVIQSDLFDVHPSVTILPVTSELRLAPLFRIAVNPSELNGLSKPLQVMVDKPQSVAREKIGKVFGHLDDEAMLAVFVGFA